jgi:hypothetical protein
MSLREAAAAAADCVVAGKGARRSDRRGPCDAGIIERGRGNDRRYLALRTAVSASPNAAPTVAPLVSNPPMNNADIKSFSVAPAVIVAMDETSKARTQPASARKTNPPTAAEVTTV